MVARVSSALDLDTGGGEVIGEMPTLPTTMVVTESWAPNVVQARALLGPRGVRVVETEAGAALPLESASFELVTARLPVRPDRPETIGCSSPEGLPCAARRPGVGLRVR